LTRPLISTQIPMISFGLNQSDLGSFGILQGLEQGYLSYGIERLMRIDQIALKGSHNIANALAALSLGYCVDLPMQSMLDTLKAFKGLPHRCQTVRTIDSVAYINDSKATNVGATVAALKGFGAKDHKNIILIAGGQAKGQDFSALQKVAKKVVKRVILIGEDADQLRSALNDCVEIEIVDSMQSALFSCHQAAESGDTVLLSPACASFDMFDGFEHRGHCFIEAVDAMASAQGCVQ
jgi:UDP-N-acetylmuramoylalanine--D-glutamate ligase